MAKINVGQRSGLGQVKRTEVYYPGLRFSHTAPSKAKVGGNIKMTVSGKLKGIEAREDGKYHHDVEVHSVDMDCEGEKASKGSGKSAQKDRMVKLGY